MKLFLLLVSGIGAWAQLESPRIGMMLDENNRARPVIGVPTAAMLGDPWFDAPIISLSCSAYACLAKTESALVSSSGEKVDTPPGAVLIAWEPGADGAAYVYFVETRQLARWSRGQLDLIDFTPDGDVVSLRATANGYDYVTSRDDDAATCTLLLDGGGVLLASDGQIRLLRADGTEANFAVADVGGFIRMSDRYVQVITSTGMWALDLQPGHEQLFLLPGVPQ